MVTIAEECTTDAAVTVRLPFRHLLTTFPHCCCHGSFTPGAADIVQPDITQCGGILETKKIAAAAETYSMMVAPHNVGGIVSTMAALHLTLTLRNGKVLEHFNDFADPGVKLADISARDRPARREVQPDMDRGADAPGRHPCAYVGAPAHLFAHSDG